MSSIDGPAPTPAIRLNDGKAGRRGPNPDTFVYVPA
jgi:hypothetical protein